MVLIITTLFFLHQKFNKQSAVTHLKSARTGEDVKLWGQGEIKNRVMRKIWRREHRLKGERICEDVFGGREPRC